MQLRVKSKDQSITLNTNAVLGTGGEARVYALSQNPNLVAKVYHTPTQDHAEKLALMLANPPGDPMRKQGHISIAWPVDLLQTANGTHDVVGFLMPCVTGMTSILNFYNPQIRQQKCPLFNYRYLHRTARNLATAVGALHKRGYVIGDINESNILVSDQALVTIVDTDSFQVPDPHTGDIYLCPVGKPEYTPPELQGISFSKIDRQPEHDLFGLAVLIFQLLMEGFHPFTGVFTGQGDPPALEDRIAQGHFPYKKKWRSPYTPSPLAPDINILHPDLKWLFFRCFETGYKRPGRRPNAKTWIKVLKKAEESLQECAQNEQHLYGKHLKKCPWCERAARLNGRDPFPSPHASQKGKQQPMSPAPQKPLPPAPSGTTAPPTQKTPPKRRKSPTRWFFRLIVFCIGFWIATQSDFEFPKFDLPSLPQPDLFKEHDTDSSPQDIPENNAQIETPTSTTAPDQLAQETIKNRFDALSQPGLSARERMQQYQKFVNDFRYHPHAESYVHRVKIKWEQASFDEIATAYESFHKTPDTQTLNTLLETARHYLHNHTQRRNTASDAVHIAQWHLDPRTHPLKLYIDQDKKLYVKVFHNDVQFAETKKSDRLTSLSLPDYKPSDTIYIEAYQDDRFDDTYLKKVVAINSMKGNHHLKIEDPRGNILIQVVFADYPDRPQF